VAVWVYYSALLLKKIKKALPICAVRAWCLEPTVQVGIYKSHQDYHDSLSKRVNLCTKKVGQYTTAKWSDSLKKILGSKGFEALDEHHRQRLR